MLTIIIWLILGSQERDDDWDTEWRSLATLSGLFYTLESPCSSFQCANFGSPLSESEPVPGKGAGGLIYITGGGNGWWTTSLRHLWVLGKCRKPHAKGRTPCFIIEEGDHLLSAINFITSPLFSPYTAKARPNVKEKEVIRKDGPMHVCGFTGHKFYKIIKQKMAFSSFTIK